VNIQAINEHLALNGKLKEHGLSTQDIDKLLNLVMNAKEYGFESKLIVRKLRSIKRLENKENKLKASCEVLSKQLIKYKEIIPVAELVHSMNVSGRELISFKVALNEAAETYGLTSTSAALDVINLIKDHNKKGQLKRDLSEMSLQKYAIDRFCSSRSQVITSLVELQNRGISEEQILQVNNFLEKNDYEIPINR
jgi:mannitol-specific phosphotransferase system IIBC component